MSPSLLQKKSGPGVQISPRGSATRPPDKPERRSLPLLRSNRDKSGALIGDAQTAEVSEALRSTRANPLRPNVVPLNPVPQDFLSQH